MPRIADGGTARGDDPSLPSRAVGESWLRPPGRHDTWHDPALLAPFVLLSNFSAYHHHARFCASPSSLPRPRRSPVYVRYEFLPPAPIAPRLFRCRHRRLRRRGMRPASRKHVPSLRQPAAQGCPSTGAGEAQQVVQVCNASLSPLYHGLLWLRQTHVSQFVLAGPRTRPR